MLYLQMLAIALSYAVTGFIGEWARNGVNYIIDIFSIAPEESTQMSAAVEGLVALSFDEMWESFLEGKNAIAESVTGVCINPLALLLFPFRGVSLIATFALEGFFSAASIKSLSLILSLVLILKSGIHAEGCYFLRIITNHTYNAVMTATSDGLTTQAQIEKMNLTQEIEAALYSRLEECKQLSTGNNTEDNPKKQCREKAIAETEKEAQDYNSKNAEGGTNIDFAQILKGVEAATAVVSFPGTAMLTALSTTIEVVILTIIENALFLSACISPIFLVFAILPGESKMANAWFSAWFSLSLFKVSYAMALGTIAQAVANHPLPNPMFLPLLNGFGAPLLAVIIAAGGGMAFFSVTSEVISGSVRLVVGAVTRGVGK